VFLCAVLASIVYMPKEQQDGKIVYVPMTQTAYTVIDNSQNFNPFEATDNTYDPFETGQKKWEAEHGKKKQMPFVKIRYDILLRNIVAVGITLECINIINGIVQKR